MFAKRNEDEAWKLMDYNEIIQYNVKKKKKNNNFAANDNIFRYWFVNCQSWSVS